MGNYQQTIIVGNVGKDPEMRYTPSGTAVTSFSVAVNSERGDTKITTWFRVSAWGKQAEVCHQYVTKGMSVLVAGELVADAKTGAPRIWTNKDGEPQTSFELNASTVRFLGGGQRKEVKDESPDVDLPDEDLPF